MKNPDLNTLYLQADEDLQKAITELNHPAEDVVKYSGCVFARKALYGFTNCLYRYYADQKQDPVQENLSLKELLEQTSKYNPDIRFQDFECVHCKEKDLSLDFDEVFYCNDIDQITECATLAKNMKKQVLQHIDSAQLKPS